MSNPPNCSASPFPPPKKKKKKNRRSFYKDAMKEILKPTASEHESRERQLSSLKKSMPKIKSEKLERI